MKKKIRQSYGSAGLAKSKTGSNLRLLLRTVLQRFQQGILVQKLLSDKVGHGAGYSQDAVVGTG